VSRACKCPALVLVFIAFVITPPAGAQPIRPVEFAASDRFSEGPVFDYDANFFFSHGDSVTRIASDGSRSVWARAQGVNGHKVLPDGTHLLCTTGAVLHLGPRGETLGTASAECNGAPLRAPNDLTLDRQGGFYFTDPGGSREAPIGTVHYVDSNGKTHLAAGGMRVPNGLVLSLDGKTLYVAETVPNRIVKFAVSPGGKLGTLEEFAVLPSRSGHQAEPDGLAIDASGNIYVAHLGMEAIQVVSPEGILRTSLPAGNYDASNLVFGGPRLNQLFITGSIGHRSKAPGRVFRLDLSNVVGVSSLLPRAIAAWRGLRTEAVDSGGPSVTRQSWVHR
jgi:gluconolactonase